MNRWIICMANNQWDDNWLCSKLYRARSTLFTDKPLLCFKLQSKIDFVVALFVWLFRVELKILICCWLFGMIVIFILFLIGSSTDLLILFCSLFDLRQSIPTWTACANNPFFSLSVLASVSIFFLSLATFQNPADLRICSWFRDLILN